MISVISKLSRTSSWEDIVEFDSLASGDIIPITLKNGERLELVVGHDETGEQIIVFRDCLKDSHNMNDRDTNRGGWKDSKMRKYAEEVFNLLPDDLQAVIIPTPIVQCINGERIVCEDKLFCLSYTQVFGNENSKRIQELEPEDHQLDIFKHRRERVKCYGEDGESYCYWWLRSPGTGSAGDFWIVITGGGYNGGAAGNSNGVCFGFRIKSKNQNSQEEEAT